MQYKFCSKSFVTVTFHQFFWRASLGSLKRKNAHSTIEKIKITTKNGFMIVSNGLNIVISASMSALP